MRIFESTHEDGFRIIAYDRLDSSLIERHLDWVRTKPALDKNIYLIFLLTDPQEIREFKSNQINNTFCLMYQFPENRDLEWMKRFCEISFSNQIMNELREVYGCKMRWKT